MQDEQRADLLHQALIEHRPLPDDLNDAELAELAALGADLERLGPEIALLAQADAAFEPAFAKRLKSTLLVTHPTAQSAGARGMSEPARVTRAARGTRTRALLRRFLAVIVLVIALLAALVVGLLYNTQRTPLLSTARATSTASRPLITAASRAVGTQAATPDIQSSQGSTGGTAHQPVAAQLPATTPGAHDFAQQSAPLHGAATKAPALQYRLPHTLPALPATVPLYTLRDQALSDAGVKVIVSHFPGMKKSTASTANMLVLKNGSEELRITRSTGEVRYSAGPANTGSAASCCPAPEAAIVSAYTWLIAHALYPAGVDPGSPIVTTRAHGITRVRFAPATRLPLTDTQTALVLVVDLDSADHVTTVHRLWPALEKMGTATLVTPRKALDAVGSGASGTASSAPGTSAPASQTFQIEQITAVYRVSSSAGRRSLEPGYLLSGRLVASTGTGQSFTQVIPATDTVTGTAP